MIYLDPRFARSDVALRRGAHISRTDYADYQFVAENFDEIERFYATSQWSANNADEESASSRWPHSPGNH